MGFEKKGKGTAGAPSKDGSYLQSAEEMVERSNHPKGAARSMPDRLLQDHVQVTADYRAKSRAKYLLSLDVVKGHSPSERLAIDVDPQDPNGYRWCSEARRQRVGQGMDGWEPVSNLEDAKKMCPTQHLREEGGKVYAGDVFLCKRPKQVNEARAALAYQRSQRNLDAAANGHGSAESVRSDGTSSSNESFSDIQRSTASAEDPGVRATAKLRVQESGD